MIKNVTTLAIGRTIALTMPTLVSPILTRLYSPEIFGTYFVFGSVLLVVGCIATLRYEVAILLPQAREAAWQLFLLSISIAFLFGMATAIVLLIAQLTEFRENIPPIFLYLLPIGVVLYGIFNSCLYWINRDKLYRKIARSNVIQAVFMSAIQLFLGYHRISFLSSGGLIIGRVSGLLLSTAYMIICVVKSLGEIYQTSVSQLLSTARLYKQYPLKSAPGTFLNTLASNLDVLVVTAFFGLVAGGIFGLATRIADIPRAIFAVSIWQVFIGSKVDKTNGEIYFTMKNAQRRILALSTLPVFCVIFIPSELFDVIFGEAWGDLSLYIGIYVIGVHVNTLVSSFSLFVIKNRPDAELVFNVALLAAKIVALVLGILVFNHLLATIILLTVSRVILFLCLGCWNYMLLEKNGGIFLKLYFSELLRISPVILFVYLTFRYFEVDYIFSVLMLAALNLLFFYIFRANVRYAK